MTLPLIGSRADRGTKSERGSLTIFTASLKAATCVQPLAQQRLRVGHPSALVLVLDPTAQDERVVILTAAVLVSAASLPQRYAIETLFRHYKSQGGLWETGQVTDLTHLARLLVGMALASWVALRVGTQVARELLATPPTGTRRTRPYEAQFSLWRLGLQRLQRAFVSDAPFHLHWRLEGWEAPHWEDHLTWHHTRAFVFHAV